jgi:hypothetical protein
VHATVLNVNAASQISVKLNGLPVTNFTFNNATKAVQFAANLAQGNNIVQVTGTNTAGSGSASTTIVYEPLPVLPPPTVQITTPSSNPFTSTLSHTAVVATVQHVINSSDILVFVNGSPYQAFNYNHALKQVTLTLGLVSGNNLVQVSAFNASGSASDNVNIVYQPVQQCDKPVVSYIQPNTPVLNHINLSNVYQVKAKVTGISGAQDVSAKVNGFAISGLSYNAANQELSFNVSLANSGNIIEIQAVNTCGGTTASTTILYGTITPPCNNPSISFSAPLPSPYVTYNTTETVLATLSEITSINQIVLKHDGMAKSNFTFDVATQQLTYAAPLKMGQNKIEIIATNSCGSKNEFTYIERRVCNKPTLSIGAPQNNAVMTTPNASVTAATTGTSTAADVSVTLNGNQVNFTYKNGAVSSVQPLQVGANTFVVTATNECGSVSQTVVVTYQPCDQPVVGWVTPVNGQGQTTQNTLAVSALTQYVAGLNEVVAKVNGQVVTPTWNNATGMVNFNASLQPGSNTIEVTVSNSCGSNSINGTIDMACPNPVISVTAPQGGNGQTTAGTYTISGSAQNATSLTATVNGTSVTPTFNSTTGAFSVIASLQTGNNSIQISATSQCGTASTNVTIAKDCPQPTIGLPASTSPVIQATSSEFTYNATSQYATGAAATVNGQSVNPVFSTANGNITLNATLGARASVTAEVILISARNIY